MKRLEIAALNVVFGGRRVVDELDFTVESGAIGCLLGPSGCGKTTVLRSIAGFETPSGGSIRIGGVPVFGGGTSLPPERRDVGIVFQDYALFPHLTVAGNIGFGLRDRPERERRARVDELLELVGMQGFAGAYPHQLSGGEQQRVALARAIAPRRSLLLLDEPFSSMDVELREQLAYDVGRILRHEGITAILVTHDQDEAFAMADEICVMHRGRAQQIASAYELYHHPANRFVADFIGDGVFVDGNVRDAAQIETDLGVLDCAPPAGAAPGDAVEVLVRPQHVRHGRGAGIGATVVERAFRGAAFQYTLETEAGPRLLSLMPSHDRFEIGDRIDVDLDVEELSVYLRAGA